MSGRPELFVVCPSCGSEVSPYVTECPYCGARVRKRAPKLDHPAGREPQQRRGRPVRASSGRPWATIAIVALSLLGLLIVRMVIEPLGILAGDWQRLVWAPFTYVNVWYQLAVLVPVAVFGALLERRHGPVLVLVLFAFCGVGASAFALAVGLQVALLGAPGAAIGLLAAWALPDIERARRGQDYDGDLLGTAVLAVAVLSLTLVVPEADPVATVAGMAGGIVAGLGLSRGSAQR